LQPEYRKLLIPRRVKDGTAVPPPCKLTQGDVFHGTYLGYISAS